MARAVVTPADLAAVATEAETEVAIAAIPTGTTTMEMAAVDAAGAKHSLAS